MDINEHGIGTKICNNRMNPPIYHSAFIDAKDFVKLADVVNLTFFKDDGKL